MSDFDSIYTRKVYLKVRIPQSKLAQPQSQIQESKMSEPQESIVHINSKATATNNTVSNTVPIQGVSTTNIENLPSIFESQPTSIHVDGEATATNTTVSHTVFIQGASTKDTDNLASIIESQQSSVLINGKETTMNDTVSYTEEEMEHILDEVLNRKQKHLQNGIQTRLKTLQLVDPANFIDRQPIYFKDKIQNLLKINQYTYCNVCDIRFQDIRQHYRKSHPEIPPQPKKKRRTKRERLIDLCNLQYKANQAREDYIPFGDQRTSEELRREFEVSSEGILLTYLFKVNHLKLNIKYMRISLDMMQLNLGDQIGFKM